MIHCILDVMTAELPYTAISRTMHIHPDGQRVGADDAAGADTAGLDRITPVGPLDPLSSMIVCRRSTICCCPAAAVSNLPRISVNPSVDMFAQVHEVLAEVDEVLAEVDEVLAQGVETSRGGLAEIAQVATDLADIAVCGSGEHAGGRGVLFSCSYPPGQVPHLAFQGCHARFEIPGVHGSSVPARADTTGSSRFSAAAPAASAPTSR